MKHIFFIISTQPRKVRVEVRTISQKVCWLAIEKVKFPPCNCRIEPIRDSPGKQKLSKRGRNLSCISIIIENKYFGVCSHTANSTLASSEAANRFTYGYG